MRALRLENFRQHCLGSVLMLLLLLTSQYVKAQTINVKGVVKDATGEALPGASVSVKGTTAGVVTNGNGEFTLVTAPNATLVVSFIGYQTLEVPATSAQPLNITLRANENSLDEVIVVAYGAVKRKDITGAVGIVNATEAKKFSTNDVGQLLQGRVAGVNVTSDGQPGAAPTIRIRGITTFGNNQPLYVIDGVLLEGSPRDFNPNDVESIQVLKDASAGALYGSRAANGVIIITTRQGKKNTPLKIEYNGYYGIDKVWQRIPVLGREDYQTIVNEVRSNAGQPLIPGNDPTNAAYIDDVDTDWQKEGLKNGMRQNHNVNFSGGGTYNTYNLSLDYFGNDGTFVGNGPTYDRYSTRVNTTFEKGIFKFGESVYYAHSHENLLTYRSDILTGNRPPLVIDLVEAVPTQMIYDPNNVGGFGGTEAEIHNVISLNAIGINKLIKNYVDVDRIFANAYGELQLLNTNGHSLKYRINGSYDRTMTRDFSFQPPFDLGYFFNQSVSRLDDGARTYTSGLVENTLNYNKAFGKHSLDVLVGQTYQYISTLNRNGHSENFTEPYFPVLDNGSNKTASGNLFETTLTGLLGRVNYNYDDRYLLTISGRRDGSSRFRKGLKNGFFPSMALAWRVSNESFFKVSKDIVTDLKLRGSYGKLGNTNIGDYLFIPTINNNIVYNFNGQKVFGGLQTSTVNTNIQWENNETTNIGLDATVLNGKFDITAEYYNRTTTGILVNVPIPSSTGSVNQSILTNAGKIRNSGLEFMVTYHKTGDLKLDISANVSTVNNKVLALGGNNEPIYGVGSKTVVGGKIGQHFGYVSDGIFQSQQEVDDHAFQSAATAPGDIRFKDLNGDDVINADDRAFLGNAIPNLNYGFNITAAYKNFDMSVFASGSSGFLINSRLYRDLMLTTDYINRHEDILNRWTPTNTNTNIPRLMSNDPNQNQRDSDREGWLQDGKYLRINTLMLGYTFKPNAIPGLSRARIYATAQNLYSFQGYKGYNPDFTSGVLEPGFDAGSFPKPRTIMLGVQLGF